VIFLPVKLPLPRNRELQVVRQRVHHGHPDPVQPAGHLVGAVIEFPARVQHGHNDLGRRAAFLGVDIHRNSAAVIGDGHRLVGVDRDDNAIAMAREGLVDGVVDDLENHVVQPRPVIGVADVHSGAFPHRIKTL